ncbi:MAG: MFS transporter [Candidatus Rokubacteria bacterium]|nr:MFS transporter [Candidatus Rokubacteria bacterium]
MPLPYPLRALAHRDYRLFWIGQLVSRVGTWMQSVAQAWLVLELTGSPLKLGVISTLQFAPVLLFAFVGGVVSDRVRKRRLIIATQVAMMIQAALLAVLAGTGRVEYWHVAVLAAVYGVANSLDMPARQSYVIELTGKADLMSAIALNSAVFNAARVIGPALAGVLIATQGVTTAFALNAVSFVAVLAALWAMRTEGAPAARESRTVTEDVVEGLRYATRTPIVMLALGLVLFVSLFVINFNVTVPLLARDALNEGAHVFGLLMASLGAGAMMGALLVAGRQRRPSPRMVMLAAAVAAAGVLALGFVRSFTVAAAVLVLTGLAQIVFTSSVNTTIQLTVPDAMRGRTMSLYVLVFVGVTPLGAFLTGWLAEHFGIAWALTVGGAAGLASVGGLYAFWSLRLR